MKFGKQLEEYELPEWRGHYFPYNDLKKKLEGMTRTAEMAACGAQGPAELRDRIEAEAVRVGDFVQRGVQGLQSQKEELESMASSAQDKVKRANRSRDSVTDESEDETADEALIMELRVLQAIGKLTEGVQRLRGFAELNHAALYKILKKHDKQLGSKEGLGVLFPRLIEKTKLGEMAPFESLEDDLKSLSLSNSSTEGLNASAEVARLAAGLGRNGSASISKGTSMYTTAHINELVLMFFLGSSFSLFLSIGVLLWIPAYWVKTYSMSYFLAPSPVFRVIFSVLLILWCLGAVLRTCDKWDINAMFIMNIDPRCRVTPEFFFARAAALTTVWVLIFGMYVVDYKWMVLPRAWFYEGYDHRASFHYVIYPVLLISLTLVGMLVPSRICRNKYKCSLLSSVWRTAVAPKYPVDFMDNTVGDVLTSLAKPLQDVPAACCYLFSVHPQAKSSVYQFREKGDTCGEYVHHHILPLIAGLPYFFRAMQCLRRHWDTNESRHLANFGKYVSCLLVVVVSTLDFSGMTIAVVSTIATVYAFVWDVRLDWGLGREDFFASTASRTMASSTEILVSPKHRMQRVNTMCVTRVARHFSRRTYWCCSVLDLVARSTWVLTLMPITIISQNLVGRTLLVSVISAIEVLRRSMWAVLRIEYEQVANASGFRALLWVPSKLNATEEEADQVAALVRSSSKMQPIGKKIVEKKLSFGREATHELGFDSAREPLLKV